MDGGHEPTMIYAFNFYCNRDLDLSEQMAATLLKHNTYTYMVRLNTDTEDDVKGYGNGSGWPQSMLKLNQIRWLTQEFDITDKDFILSVDSDVVFTSPEVFKYVKPDYGIIGVKHRPDYYTLTGNWSHMSGCLIFIRGDIARKMAAIPEMELDNIRMRHFKGFNLTENEDVVLSYLAKYVGANWFDLGEVPGLSSGDFERDVSCFKTRQAMGYMVHDFRSFYHLNYCPTQFLGEPVEGKWDIPKVLKKKGIEI